MDSPTSKYDVQYEVDDGTVFTCPSILSPIDAARQYFQKHQTRSLIGLRRPGGSWDYFMRRTHWSGSGSVVRPAKVFG